MDRLGELIGRARCRGRAGTVRRPGSPPGSSPSPVPTCRTRRSELLAAVSAQGWVDRAVVRNDVFALLRAGTDRSWGVAVVCGAGINAVGVGPDGAVARFPALGAISGDWGGGYDVGMAALGAAVRSIDGRGPATALADIVAGHFGRPDPVAVMTAMHLGELADGRVLELPPAVFAAARAGDEVACGIVLRLAGEVVACATGAIRRLGLQDRDPDVVLGGSLLRAGLPLLDDAVRAGVLAVAPAAVVSHVAVAPVVGAAQLALEEVGATPAAHEKAHQWGLGHEVGGAVR